MKSPQFQNSGLTTGESAFINESYAKAEMFIAQPYDLYSAENHLAWSALFARMRPQWEKYANEHFLAGLKSLALPPERIPRLSEVNAFLEPLTHFQAKAVSGYIPAFIFFDCLRNRQFPTTITVRRSDKLDYLPEPDIFHDIAGHVPMHTDPAFADALVRFGDCAHTAAELAADIHDPVERVRRLTSIIKAMARFFWFTVEFGLMQSEREIKVYGSGLLSSYGEISHAVTSNQVQRFPIQLEWVINQGFEIDHFQPLLFSVTSFSHLFELVDRLEHWMRQGKLDNVAPGEPNVNAQDLASFLLQ